MPSDRGPQPLTVAALADAIGGRLIAGDGDRVVLRIAPTDRAGPDAVTFVTRPKYLPALENSAAAAVILARWAIDAPRSPSMAVIVVDDPYVGFARAAQRLTPPPPGPAAGRHPSAVVDPTAVVGREVAIGPLVYVGPGVRLGDRAVLYAGVHVEADAVVGDDTVLCNHVVVGHGCRIGARCVLHPGVVVGADGFGFARPGAGERSRVPVKIPHAGAVVIEDEVEIGANACIDRGTFEDTRIGRAAKLDNLVQVGHNVSIGEACILVAQSGVAGSSRIEAEATLGAQSGVSGHLTVGEKAVVYGQAGVMRDVPPDTKVAGTPAEPRTSFFRRWLSVRKLDEWGERVRELEEAVRGRHRR